MLDRKQESLATINGMAFSPRDGDGFSDPELSLTELLRTVFKRKLIIISSAITIFCIVAVYTLVMPRVYESVVRLQIDPSRSSSLGLDEMISEKLGSSDGNSRLLTELKVIQSDTVAMRVIDSLGLAKQQAFAGKTAAEAKVTDPLAMSPHDRQRLLTRFQSALKVQILPNTQLVEVRFRSTDPKLSTAVANAIVEKYMERNLQTRYEGTVQVSNWLSKQMEDLQAKAVESQQKLADFQKQNNILGADENDNIVVDRLKLLNQQLTEAEADRIVKEARHRLAATGNPELVGAIDPNLQTLRTQEADLKISLAQLNSKYGSGYPKLREMQAQLGRLDTAIASEVANVGKRLDDEYLSAAKTESSLRSQFNQQKEEAYKLNEHAVQYAVLKHDVENGRELYDTLQLKLRMAGVSAGLNSSYISVVDRAELPANPIEPKINLNLILGALGGLVTGLLLAFVRESLDDTLSSSEELESCIGIPVLCSIPANENQGRAKAEVVDTSKLLPPSPLLLNYPRSQAAEAFRGLRTSLLLSSPDRQPKIIVVASSVAAEGKTTVSTNLGVTFAQRGESVLLIDADLRRSTMHDQFGLPHARYGTSTVLTQGMDERAILTPLEALPNLKLMPAGPHPPNPAELLGSKRMAEVLASLSEHYDRIIVDTPPVLSVADSLALANLSDAVVLVVRSGVARKKAVLRVRDLLRRANCNVVGVVFNYVNLRLEHYYYAQGSYYGKSMSNYYETAEED
jgi:capsular exopolysaccharide synthesis family protein